MTKPKEIEIVNAQIEYTRLGMGANDGRGFGCWIGLDYGGSGQGFGGYSLTFYDKSKEDEGGYENCWVGTAWGMNYLVKLMNAIGVDEWESLKGKHVRVKREAGWGGRILGIGHIIKDTWFIPEEDLKYFFNEDGTVK